MTCVSLIRFIDDDCRYPKLSHGGLNQTTAPDEKLDPLIITGKKTVWFKAELLNEIGPVAREVITGAGFDIDNGSAFDGASAGAGFVTEI